ncbi:alcohol dehydrogenase catalytic domain-containing protein [Providencia sp. PROV202]|uniref:alcohol dehydrogenase catalytic domain-containing protein n=1 Tax=Providencia sp. PROV202 TaxID=2949902 RepID=UPI00234AF151|nr:alcohol dehydrogenase catalytic domain-containing protein [Providencia sp. PROV202]
MIKSIEYDSWQYDASQHSVIQRTSITRELADNEILIQNAAAGINPVDYKFIQSNPLNWASGHIPGVDGAGIIVSVGHNVAPELIGRRVCYHAPLLKPGSFARYTILNSNSVMMIPEEMSFSLAAAVPCPLLTAWQSAEKVPVNNSESVLVSGLGAVNQFLVQILRQRGFLVDVISASATQDTAAKLGINQLFRHHSKVDKTYFAIFDATGPEYASLLVPHLKANGHIVSILGRIELPVDPAFTTAISYHEVALAAIHQFGEPLAITQLMLAGEALIKQISTGDLICPIPDTFAFEQLPQALLHSENAHIKTVVTF